MRILRPRLAVLTLSLTLFGACSFLPLVVDDKATAPVLDGFGASTFEPSHGKPAARALFAHGVAQGYAFNRAEAVRYFKAALAQDPECGMCAWAVAFEMGPNINNPDRDDLTVATKYVDYALKHSEGASPRDRALMQALAMRYGRNAGPAIVPPQGELCATPGGGEKANPLDVDYAATMRELVRRYPDDPDLLAFYAEAEMVATRADWWDPATGKPAGRIGELASMIEAGLKQHPEHVGLMHYMIHVVDAPNVASRAVDAADRLGALAPKSPHLLHMPSHTYAHVGRYADATRVNQLAVAADEAMMAELKKQNFDITWDWRGHNGHFQWYGALMEGRSARALESARASAGRSKRDSEFSEYVRSLPMLTLLHLQRWDALLKEPMPTGEKGMAIAIGQMARGIALARTGDLDGARAALDKLKPAAAGIIAKSSDKDRFSRLLRSVVGSAQAELGAEIACAEKRYDDALALQSEAVAAATDAELSEPPMLASGPRQRLGNMQLRTKRYADAEKSFRDDLAARAASGWALHGLQQALAAQGKDTAAQAVQRDLSKSWGLADSEVRNLR